MSLHGDILNFLASCRSLSLEKTEAAKAWGRYIFGAARAYTLLDNNDNAMKNDLNSSILIYNKILFYEKNIIYTYGSLFVCSLQNEI